MVTVSQLRSQTPKMALSLDFVPSAAQGSGALLVSTDDHAQLSVTTTVAENWRNGVGGLVLVLARLEAK